MKNVLYLLVIFLQQMPSLTSLVQVIQNPFIALRTQKGHVVVFFSVAPNKIKTVSNEREGGS